jgi:hypothetical protein
MRIFSLLSVSLLGFANGDKCNATTTHCYANPKNVIHKESGVLVDACCDLCLNFSKCASYRSEIFKVTFV